MYLRFVILRGHSIIVLTTARRHMIWFIQQQDLYNNRIYNQTYFWAQKKSPTHTEVYVGLFKIIDT